MNFLQEALKLHRWTDLSSIISSFPPLLWLSKANIKEKVLFLEKEFELDNDELRDIIVTYPQILGLSVRSNLRQKIDYFIGDDDDDEGENVSLSRHELKELVLYQVCMYVSLIWLLLSCYIQYHGEG